MQTDRSEEKALALSQVGADFVWLRDVSLDYIVWSWTSPFSPESEEEIRQDAESDHSEEKID
jgi:hypothetical protein